MEQLIQLKLEFVRELKTMNIAIAQDKANQQHYEVPDEFYLAVLGPRLKYSCCLFEKDTTTLVKAEILMLDLYCERAELKDGMTLIDLGCGWGSLSLYLAAKYPNSNITSISNSNSQREFIMAMAAKRRLSNVTVYTGDISTYDLPLSHHGRADRVLSIEMFEHMKNYQLLLRKVSRWLTPNGKLFIHIFAQKDSPYHFRDSWMAENFFTGGTMPSVDLFLYFQDDLKIENQWIINGVHYQRTLEAWLQLMDSKKAYVLSLFTKCYGAGEELKWYVKWRLFFISCAEFFGLKDGEENLVAHYLFVKPTPSFV